MHAAMPGFQFISSQWGSVERTRHGRKNRHLFLEEGKNLLHVTWLQEIPGVAADALRSYCPQPRVSLIDASGLAPSWKQGLAGFGLCGICDWSTAPVTLVISWISQKYGNPFVTRTLSLFSVEWKAGRQKSCAQWLPSPNCVTSLSILRLSFYTHTVFQCSSITFIYLFICVGHTPACSTGYRWKTASYHGDWGDQTQVTKLGSKPL